MAAYLEMLHRKYCYSLDDCDVCRTESLNGSLVAMEWMELPFAEDLRCLRTERANVPISLNCVSFCRSPDRDSLQLYPQLGTLDQYALMDITGTHFGEA